MKYYRILYSNEYAKKSCRFGILDGDFDRKESIFKDGEILSNLYIETECFLFDGNDNQIFADFQMTYFTIRVVSEKMKSVLEVYSNDKMLFLPVTVKKGKENVTHYILHFNEKLDVLDKVKTGDSLISPKIDESKMNSSIQVFCYSEFDPRVFCISELVKKDLEENNITGVSYQLIS